jgi:hypothetical protein
MGYIDAGFPHQPGSQPEESQPHDHQGDAGNLEQEGAKGSEIGADQSGTSPEGDEDGAESSHEKRGIAEDFQLRPDRRLARDGCRPPAHVADVSGDKRKEAGGSARDQTP